MHWLHIEQDHITHISTCSISVFRFSVEIEVTNDKPIKIIWHLNIFKPVHEFYLAFTITRPINWSENLGIIIVDRREFHRNCKPILENLMTWEDRTLPDYKNTPWSSNRRDEAEVIKRSEAKFSNISKIKNTLLVFWMLMISHLLSVILFLMDSHLLSALMPLMFQHRTFQDLL